MNYKDRLMLLTIVLITLTYHEKLKQVNNFLHNIFRRKLLKLLPFLKPLYIKFIVYISYVVFCM